MAKKGSILVCDDEEIMRDVLGTILSGAGYKVELARTGCSPKCETTRSSKARW